MRMHTAYFDGIFFQFLLLSFSDKHLNRIKMPFILVFHLYISFLTEFYT